MRRHNLGSLFQDFLYSYGSGPRPVARRARKASRGSPNARAWHHCHSAICAAALLGCLAGRQEARAQLTIMDNFNSGMDTAWTHYAPLQTAPWNEQNSWSFPGDGAGGFSYRIFGGVPNIGHDPASDQQTGPARVGSFRNDSTYTDFSAGVDIVNWNDAIPENVGFLAFHVTAPGFLTTLGYFAGYSRRQWNDQMATFGFVHFQSELTVSGVNEYTGGAALTPRLSPNRKLRMVATGIGTLFTAALYDRTDLLEPLVKIAGADNSEPNGTSGIGAVNYSTDDDKIVDFTWDNYYSSPNPQDPVGFPGTPQVTQLVPAPQTLFYTIPSTNRITFSLKTFSTNQIATNALKMFLNGTDVSSQLALSEIRAPLLGTPFTNFSVRYTGPLASNAFYNGQIVVLDTGGKGTTNNFVFDTFATNGMLLAEAEDYNHDSGQYMDNPPVSGTDTNGATVNGGGVGYYGLSGVEGVDFHDTETGNSANNNQYRLTDGVGTMQNLYAGDTPRPDHLATNVPDYIIWRMLAGEWLNFTRTFPANRWNVYLRTSSQNREDVRFDEVTGDRTMPNQATALRGLFLVPNTGSSTRFRYVPLTDAAGNNQVLDFAGLKTFRMTALGGLVTANDGDGTGSFQPTYFLFLPTTNPAPTRPWIALASPSAGAVDVPLQPTVQLTILNRSTAASCPGSIQLRFDGVDVTSSAIISCSSSEGPGASVTYAPPGYLQPNSTHTIGVVFSDGSGTQSNQWSFTTANLPLIPASFALAGNPSSNFSVQVHKAPNNASYNNPADGQAFPNSSWRAERQLANQLIQASTLTPYTNEAANTPTNYGFYTEPVAINYEECGNPAGFFTNDVNFPGIYPSNYCPGAAENFAVAALIKVPVAAGIYRMGVRSDDGFKVTVGTNLTAMWTNAPQTEMQLGIYDSGRGSIEITFDFVVATNGLYNFRLLYEQGGGGADCEWYWVNRNTGTRELVRPLQLESATAVNGPYAIETGALIDPGAKAITVPRSGNSKFYRLRSTTGYALSVSGVSGNNLVLSYQ